MAKVQFNTLVTDVRNRLGNIVFSKWKQTNYVRKHSPYSRGSSPKQVEIRNAFRDLVSIWKAMGGLMQGSWDTFAKRYNMTGYNAFIGANSTRLISGDALELFKPGGEEAPTLFPAEAPAAGEIRCPFTMPDGAADKYLFFFTQKKDSGKGTDAVRRHDAGRNAVSPFTIAGLDAGAEYFIYAVIADDDYSKATKASASAAITAKAGS